MIKPKPLRVMVVDDTVLYRKIVSDALATIAGVEVVGNFIELNCYPIDLAGYKWLWIFMAISMGQVKNTIADLCCRAIGLQIRQDCGHNCIGTVGTYSQVY
jgi:hypothetical protein